MEMEIDLRTVDGNKKKRPRNNPIPPALIMKANGPD